MERRAGIEPANTGFADPRVSRLATGASQNVSFNQTQTALILVSKNTKTHQPSGGWVIGVSVLIFSELVRSTRPPRSALTTAETHREREGRTHRTPHSEAIKTKEKNRVMTITPPGEYEGRFFEAVNADNDGWNSVGSFTGLSYLGHPLPQIGQSDHVQWILHVLSSRKAYQRMRLKNAPRMPDMSAAYSTMELNDPSQCGATLLQDQHALAVFELDHLYGPSGNCGVAITDQVYPGGVRCVE